MMQFALILLVLMPALVLSTTIPLEGERDLYQKEIQGIFFK